MSPIRLIAAATLASCGLFLAQPAISAAMPATTVLNPAAAVDTADSGLAPTQYAQRDRDRSREWERRTGREHYRDRHKYRDRDRDRDDYRGRDRDRHRRDFRERDRSRYRWDYDRHERWRTKRHPRRPHWRGRHLPRHGRYLVITNYWDYYLPPPPYGHYYVREGNDVFLVLEATRMIIDAFILFELLGR